MSGINTCLNAGSDIIFSGTFGAAQEGTFQRIPSLAVSLRTHGVPDYEFAAEFTAKISRTSVFRNRKRDDKSQHSLREKGRY